MNKGINSQKLFYIISSFFLLILIIFTLRVNYASSAGEDLKAAAGSARAMAATSMPEAEKAAVESAGKDAENKIAPVAKHAEDSIGPKNASGDTREISAPADAISTIISKEKTKKLSGAFSIVVDKNAYVLKLYKGGRLVKKYKIAIGRNPDGADKKEKGDLRTPEGNFYIVSIHKSDKWIHNGTYAYGPWFLRLKTPWSGVGIHGTDVPETLGTKASEGCIRLHSNDIAELKSLVEDQVKKGKEKVTVSIVASSPESE